jgi:hypothetical protein
MVLELALNFPIRDTTEILHTSPRFQSSSSKERNRVNANLLLRFKDCVRKNRQHFHHLL